MRPALLLLFVIFTLSTLGCATRVSVPVTPVAPRSAQVIPRATVPAALCEIAGNGNVPVVAAAGGFSVGSMRDASIRGRVDRLPTGLVFRAEVSHGGYQLLTAIPLARHDVFRIGRDVMLSSVVGLTVNAQVRVVDARPGQLQVTASTQSLERARLRVIEPLQPSVIGCDETSFDGNAVYETNGELRQLNAGPVTLAATAGGEAAVELVESTFARWVDVLREEGEYSFVITRASSGVFAAGYLLTSQIAPPPEQDEMLANILGAIGSGGREREICQTGESLALYAARGMGRSEQIGTVAPGTRFVKIATSGSQIRLRPHQSSFFLNGDVSLWATPRQAPTCERVASQGGPGSILGELSGSGVGSFGGLGIRGGTIDARAELTARVTSASGLSGVSDGDSCTVEFSHRDRSTLPCRVKLVCNGVTLFGFRESNGYFECEFESDPFRVNGEDSNTSGEGGGDPAMRLDTSSGALSIRDDAAGPVGAFTLEARIESTRVLSENE